MSWKIKAGTESSDFLPPTLKTSLRTELWKLSWKPVRRQIHPCGGTFFSLVTWTRSLSSGVPLQQKELYDKKQNQKPNQPNKKDQNPPRTRPGGFYILKKRYPADFSYDYLNFFLVYISFPGLHGFTFQRTNKSTKHQRTGAGQGSGAARACAEGAAHGPEQSPLCPFLLTQLQQHTACQGSTLETLPRDCLVLTLLDVFSFQFSAFALFMKRRRKDHPFRLVWLWKSVAP